MGSPLEKAFIVPCAAGVFVMGTLFVFVGLVAAPAPAGVDWGPDMLPSPLLLLCWTMGDCFDIVPLFATTEEVEEPFGADVVLVREAMKLAVSDGRSYSGAQSEEAGVVGGLGSSASLMVPEFAGVDDLAIGKPSCWDAWRLSAGS